MGESPIRPYRLLVIPPVDVPAAKLPCWSRATAPTVPVWDWVFCTVFFAFCVLAAGPAGAASSGYEVLQTPLVDTDSVDSLGTVLCKAQAGALRSGDSVSLRLPSDCQFLRGSKKDQVMNSRDWKVVSTASSVYSNYIEVPDR